MTLLGRATQVGSLVFGNALFMCAFRGWAVFPLVLSCVVLALLESEAKLKHSDRSLAALQGTNPFPCLPDPLWRAFATRFGLLQGDEQAGADADGGGTARARRKLAGCSFCCNAVCHLSCLGILAVLFFSGDHVDNDYNATVDSDMPMAAEGAEQHYPCRERTAGIVGFFCLLALSAALMALSFLLDPMR